MPTEPEQPPDHELKRQERRQRHRRIVAFCLGLFLVLTWLENRVFQLGAVSFPVSGNVLVFALINVNVILLLLMVFLTMRALVELVFDRRRQTIGATLRTKLVISFVSLSLIPTTLLFVIALQFVSSSMDYWFNSHVDASLETALSLAQEVYQENIDRAKREGELIALSLQADGEANLQGERARLRGQMAGLNLRLLAIYGPDRQPLLELMPASGVFPKPAPDLLRRAGDGERDITSTLSLADGELILALTPFTLHHEPHVLMTGLLIPKERLGRLELVSKGAQGYRQLLLLKQPIKTSLLVMLLIITLLIIFSAIWFGFYVAGGLTRPMAKLSQGLKRVADGELDFELEQDSSDEMGSLVDSFNRMTRDLLASKGQVEEAHQRLQ
ncbi:MAG: HAMP domain-containing protein, partial [Desulfobacteraceae bacterium]|nr:HAMP domain-containing protein [Desulfobacteraceae bacterium]